MFICLRARTGDRQVHEARDLGLALETSCLRQLSFCLHKKKKVDTTRMLMAEPCLLDPLTTTDQAAVAYQLILAPLTIDQVDCPYQLIGLNWIAYPVTITRTTCGPYNIPCAMVKTRVGTCTYPTKCGRNRNRKGIAHPAVCSCALCTASS